MSDNKGIGGLLGRQLTLEERIEAHLMRALTDAELRDDYVDPTDRQNVRHRALISAVLNACFAHGFPDGAADIVEIEVAREPNIWSELTHARNAFNRDAILLNNGNRAEQCLSTVPKESIIPVNTIGVDRELLVVWLATIEVWDKKRDSNRFRTLKAIFDAAAEACGTTSSSYKTNRSAMKRNIKGKGNRFSQEEQKMYRTLIQETKYAAAQSREASSAFALLFPAARALSEQKTHTKLSADKLKG